MLIDWSHLREDYERLGSFKAVAKEYHVAPETVSRKAKELGVRHIRRWRQENMDPGELRKAYEGGTSVADLAKQFKCGESTVYLRLWMTGTEMRRSGHNGWKWGPEQHEKRVAAVARGAFQGAQKERFARIGQRAAKMNSPQEQMFQQALIRAYLSFETQARIIRFYPDVKLHQQPILVEIDGWAHALPGPARFDENRDAELAEAGYTVVRFTNEQVEEDADGCVRQLIERFGLLPEEDPVAIIRTRRGETPGTDMLFSDEDIV